MSPYEVTFFTGKLLFAWGQSRCLYTKLLFSMVSYFLPGGSRDVSIRSYFLPGGSRDVSIRSYFLPGADAMSPYEVTFFLLFLLVSYFYKHNNHQRYSNQTLIHKQLSRYECSHHMERDVFLLQNKCNNSTQTMKKPPKQ